MDDEFKRLSERWRLRAYQAWTLVGVCILVGVFLYICNILLQAVAAIIITALIVFLLHGVVQQMQNHGIPRALGTTIAYLACLLIFLACLGTIIPAIVTQTSEFASNISSYTDAVSSWFRNFAAQLPLDSTQLSTIISSVSTWFEQTLASLLQSTAGGAISGVMNFGSALAIFFIALICAFWLLLDLPKISVELKSLFNDRHRKTLKIITDAFGVAVYGWAKSTLICAIVTGFVSGIAFWICGIPYSAVLGFLCGLLYIVPYVGSAVSCFIVALIALLVSPFICLLSIVINVVINNVVSNVLSPKLMKDSVNIHPALLLIVILIGGALAGIAGMLLSIPCAAALHGVFITLFEARTGRTLATEDGALFRKKLERASSSSKDKNAKTSS